MPKSARVLIQNADANSHATFCVLFFANQYAFTRGYTRECKLLRHFGCALSNVKSKLGKSSGIGGSSSTSTSGYSITSGSSFTFLFFVVGQRGARIPNSLLRVAARRCNRRSNRRRQELCV